MAANQTFHWHYSDFDDTDFQIRGRTLFFLVVLVCVILFITLAYMYARWVCRIADLGSPPRLGNAPSQQTTPPPQGLDPNAIGNLPMILHHASANSNEAECSICLGMFRDGEKVKVLPDCRHFYHSECVDEWLRTQSSCPLCRASLQLESPV